MREDQTTRESVQCQGRATRHETRHTPFQESSGGGCGSGGSLQRAGRQLPCRSPKHRSVTKTRSMLLCLMYRFVCVVLASTGLRRTRSALFPGSSARGGLWGGAKRSMHQPLTVVFLGSRHPLRCQTNTVSARKKGATTQQQLSLVKRCDLRPVTHHLRYETCDAQRAV